MDETELLQRLDSLREQGKIDEGIKLLKENTGKGKIMDPSDTPKMEKIWSLFANPLMVTGQIENSIKIYGEMFSHLMYIQDQDNTRVHKGLCLFNGAHGFLRRAFQYYMLSFVEDTISSSKYPEEALSTAALQGIFKTDSEFLHQLSDKICQETPAPKDPNALLTKLGVKQVPAELWELEYAMQETERKLRVFIEKKLASASKEWWEKWVPDKLRERVEKTLIDSSRVLWFSEQPASPLEYLSFPQDYVEIITSEQCWPYFKDTFKHAAIFRGRLEGLGHIRHKIAHYRRISEDEKIMFKRTIQWLKDSIK
jgi:hypothetical protein